MDGDDLGKGGAGASATGVFGMAGKEPVKEDGPVAAEPVPVSAPPARTEPASEASSGGFTQLLRALNYDAVKEVQAKEVQTAGNHAAVAAGGSTVPVQGAAAGSPGEAATVSKPAGPVAPGQVTSFLPQSAPPPVPAVPAAPSGPVPGSFTQLFQKLDVEPAAEVLAEKPVAVQAVESPSFTQLFAVPVPMAAAIPLAQQEEPPPASAGSFTQLFVTVDAQPEPQAAPLTMDVEPSPTTPGSFTQMFQALGAPAAEEEARYAPPPRVEAPPQSTAPSSSPGSFTQMFRTLGEEPQRAKEPEAGPGSFTQMFQSVAPTAPAVPPPPSSYERPFAANAPGREDGGASQMFATYREPVPAIPERGPAFSAREPAPLGPPPVSSTPSSGGLTALLRTLDQPTQAPKPYAAPSYPAPVAPDPQPGSFTGVYGQLGGTSPTSAVPPQAPAPGPSLPAAAGPSEFTRLINASALREAALRGGEAGVAAPAPAAPSAAGGAGFAMPGGMPAVPQAAFATPTAPSASVVGPGGAHGAVSAAGGGQASFAPPKIPSMPPVKVPEMPKAAGAPAGLQKYVPLLLILVIFLLVAILVAVMVLMKK